MDRRMLAAIFLSMAVILLFQTFLFPKQEPPATTESSSDPLNPPALVGTDESESGENQTRIQTPAQTQGPDTAVPSLPVGELESAAASEEEIVIETDLYRGVLTNRGGRIQSWRLLEYTDPVGERVELVLGRPEVGLTLQRDGGPQSWDSVLFNVERATTSDGGQKVTFSAGSGEQTVTKTYYFKNGSYSVGLDVDVRGPAETSGYYLTWSDGIPRAEKNPKQYETSVGSVVMVGDSKETIRPKEFKRNSTKEVQGAVRWAGVRNKYFGALIVPPAETSSRVITTGNNEQRVTGVQLAMPALSGAADHRYDLWLGPLQFEMLKETGLGLEKAVDLGWSVFRPLSKLLMAAMNWVYGFIPNYGWVIIIISVATKVLFYPLTKTSIKSMRAMQKVQPEMTAIREKYKKDPQRMQAEMMVLYKKHGANPLGGCLPILVQSPVFIALYGVLNNDIAMRNAPFIAWINDLSSPDTLFNIAGFPLHVLPIVLFGFTFAQMAMSPSMGDPRQKMMAYMMPLVTLFIFYGFPSGLNLYWTVNTVLTVAQQWWIHRADPPPAAPPAVAK